MTAQTRTQTLNILLQRSLSIMTSQDKHKRSLVSRLPFFGATKDEKSAGRDSSEEDDQGVSGAPKWSFGVLNDKQTVEVPGKPNILKSSRIARVIEMMTNLAQVLFCFCQTTKTSHLVCAMRRPGHRTPLCLLESLLSDQSPPLSRAMARRRLQTRKSSWIHSRRTQPTIRSTGPPGVEMLLFSPLVCTA